MICRVPSRRHCQESDVGSGQFGTYGLDRPGRAPGYGRAFWDSAAERREREIASSVRQNCTSEYGLVAHLKGTPRCLRRRAVIIRRRKLQSWRAWRETCSLGAIRK